MLNESNMEQIRKLSDDELRKKLDAAVLAGNIRSEKLKGALRDTGKVREMLSGMTADDVTRFLRIIGRDKAQKMADELKNEVGK